MRPSNPPGIERCCSRPTAGLQIRRDTVSWRAGQKESAEDKSPNPIPFPDRTTAGGGNWQVGAKKRLEQAAQNGQSDSLGPEELLSIRNIKWALQLKNACSPLSGCLAGPPPGQPPGRKAWDPRRAKRVNTKSTLNLDSETAAPSSATTTTATTRFILHLQPPGRRPSLSHRTLQDRPALARMGTVANGYLDR